MPPDQFLYGRKGPWPQPSPTHPLKEAAEVLNIPGIETLLWNNTIGLRYLMTREGFLPVAAAKAVAGCDLPLPDDNSFNTMMLKTAYTRFRKPLSEADKKRIGGRTLNWKYDFSAMALVQPLHEVYSDGLAAYRAGAWAQAQKCFELCLEGYEQDLVVRSFAQRCRNRSLRGIAWDGIERPAKS